MDSSGESSCPDSSLAPSCLDRASLAVPDVADVADVGDVADEVASEPDGD
jgi:hypothetical protein